MKDVELAMLLHDGELSFSELEAAQARAEADPRFRATLDNLRLASDLVREVELERLAGAPDVSEAVMAAVALQQNAGQASAKRLRSPATPLRRMRFPAAIAAAGLALAAGVALLVQAPAEQSLPLARLSSGSGPASVGPAAVLAVVESPGPGVSIESVDFGATRGAIFLMSEGASETMVVWTIDDANANTRGVDL